MPRGPFDREIKDPDAKGDHARKRREEFLKKRYPGGEPEAPPEVEKKKTDQKPARKKTGGKSGDSQ